MLSKVIALLQGKALVTAVAAVLLVGGATAAFAATPQGQTVVRNIIHTTATVSHDGTPEAKGTAEAKKGNNGCPGLPDAQNLAAHFHLSTASSGSAVQTICALHNGTFKGTTPNGAAVTAQRVYGYGEIEQLLTLAQSMAMHNASAKLTDANVSSLLAAALHSCVSSHSIEDCVRDNTSSNGNGNGNGNNPGSGKPTSTPTPPPMPTPHH